MLTTTASSGSKGSLSSVFRIDLLNSDNYQPWKVKITDILTSLRLQDHLIEGSPKTGDGSEAKWKRKDLQILSHIWLHIADSVLVYISGATTAKEAWDTLRQTYQLKGVISQVTTCRRFFWAECAEGSDVSEHIRYMRSLLDKIHAASETSVISDTESGFVLLVSLPELWNSFIQLIDTTSDKLTSAEIIARILQKDQRCKAREGAKEDSAMVAKQPQKKCIKCFNCGKTSHMKCKCRTPGGGATGNAQGDKTKGNGRNTGNSTTKANDAVDQDFDFVAIKPIEAMPENDTAID
jgi:hypothetical protein